MRKRRGGMHRCRQEQKAQGRLAIFMAIQFIIEIRREARPAWIFFSSFHIVYVMSVRILLETRVSESGPRRGRVSRDKTDEC